MPQQATERPGQTAFACQQASHMPTGVWSGQVLSLKIQWTVWGKDSVWLYRDSLKGLEYGLGNDWECAQNDVGVHHKSPIVNTQNKGQRCTIAPFLSACSQQSMVSTTKGFADFQSTQTWRWGSWNLRWLSMLPNQAQEYNFGRIQTSEFWDQNNAFKPEGHLS